ncbi:hypothetical protein Q0M94_18080 (plasmid) [Deinococcus radiomollis]|uniref:hypothetical protein n=1 Tax=Deinococcus radiomollis TaxID=468916 RepID=UPI0038927F8B
MTSFSALLARVVLYSLGTTKVYPSQQTLKTCCAPPEHLGRYFGLIAIRLSVGGAVGKVIGGELCDLGQRLGPSVPPWLGLVAVGLLTAGLWWALKGGGVTVRSCSAESVRRASSTLA